MRKPAVLVVALALAMIGVAACGGDDDDDGGAAATTQTATEAETAEGGSAAPSGSTVRLSADPDGIIAYDTTALAATSKNGAIEIDFTNPSLSSHDVRIEDAGGKDVGGTEIISEGEQSVKLDLEPGEYTFYCSVGDHRRAGMEGTLTVE